jgi:hypothetical protein
MTPNRAFTYFTETATGTPFGLRRLYLTFISKLGVLHHSNGAGDMLPNRRTLANVKYPFWRHKYVY